MKGVEAIKLRVLLKSYQRTNFHFVLVWQSQDVRSLIGKTDPCSWSN